VSTENPGERTGKKRGGAGLIPVPFQHPIVFQEGGKILSISRRRGRDVEASREHRGENVAGGGENSFCGRCQRKVFANRGGGRCMCAFHLREKEKIGEGRPSIY